MPYLISNVAWNISCTIHINPSCIQKIKIYKRHEIPHHCSFKAGNAEIDKNQEYSNFFHTYYDVDHARNITERRSVTSTVHLFNETIIDWCDKKQYDTPRISSNAETRAIYTGVLDQDWIRNFFGSIGCPIGSPSKLHEDNKETIKRVFSEIVIPQYRPLNVLINSLYEIRPRKTFEMVDKL